MSATSSAPNGDMSRARGHQAPFMTPRDLPVSPFPAEAVSAYVDEAPPPVSHHPHARDALALQAPLPPVRTPPGGLSRRALVLACTYIEENLGENFTLDDLAGAVGVSRFHFSRQFRVSTGQSPMRYSLRLRIERAKEMLLQRGRKHCDVAMALGFFDESHFSRTFRRITGVAPREYVRMCDVAEVAV